MRLKHGFTLIELLVVIAIISILAAILFPVFAAARRNARKIACLSNLRQIGTSAALYVQDYDETLFPMQWPRTGTGNTYSSLFATSRSTTWAELLQPYTASVHIFTCPERSDIPYKGYSINCNSSAESFPGAPTPPGNWGDGAGPGRFSPTTADLVSDSSTIWFYDSNPNILMITRMTPWADLVATAQQRPTTVTPLNVDGSRLMAQILRDAGPRAETSTLIKDSWRHGEGMNIAWCDGHASYKKPSQIKEQWWNIEQIAQPAE
jgi:prepilin-type N-terminal cleavage/methylation domain-containing protein/prepilin-type processing-associated H-X9-DG protein